MSRSRTTSVSRVELKGDGNKYEVYDASEARRGECDRYVYVKGTYDEVVMIGASSIVCSLCCVSICPLALQCLRRIQQQANPLTLYFKQINQPLLSSSSSSSPFVDDRRLVVRGVREERCGSGAACVRCGWVASVVVVVVVVVVNDSSS